MKINDTRGKTQNLKFDELIAGEVYVSCRLQVYILATEEDISVDIDDGTVYRDHDFNDDDEFIPVHARLEIE